MIEALFFDWGDTVMRVFPECRGPMATWPRVEAVDGIGETLAALRARYRLALITNASESGAALVRAALARVGLERYFDAVLTARELGVRKPDPAFFRAALGTIGCAPHEAAMVGDDYQADVAGAKAVGLRAIWFNVSAAACPAGHPLHDGEVGAPEELPGVLEGLHLPDVGECLALLAEQELPPPVLEHAQAVALIAYRLACNLRERRERVDPILAHRGGLLHDLDKWSSRRLQETHGSLAGRLLRARGHPDLAAIAERHLVFTILDPATRPATWEEKLVYYADKIAEGATVVPVEERLQALCGRYPENAGRLRSCLPYILQLEAGISDRLGRTTEELRALLRGPSAAEPLPEQLAGREGGR